MTVVKITNTIAEQTSTDKACSLIWDSDLKGFGLKVTKSGHKSYLIKYRVVGDRRTRRLTIGKHGVFTATKAREVAKGMLALARLGDDPGAARCGNVGTLAQVMDIFEAQHVKAKLKPRTAAEYTNLIKGKILPALGPRVVRDISRADIGQLHHKMRDTPRQANHTIAVLSKFFNWCEQHGHIDGGANPCRHIARYAEAKRSRYLTLEELNIAGQILDAASDTFGHYVVSALKLLILTGARTSEILTLQWSFIDHQRRVARLPDSKTGEKDLHLSPGALRIISDVQKLRGNPYIICGLKQGSHLTRVSTQWKRMIDGTPLEGVRVHDLRHTFASHGVINGASLQVVSSLLGHTQITTTQRYAHLSSDPVQRACDDIGSSIESALSGGAHVVRFDSRKKLKG